MSRSVTYKGVTLVKPGAASFLDASAYQNIVTEGLGVIAIIGEANEGAPGIAQFSSAKDMEAYYGTGDLANAARIAFGPLSDNRVGDVHAQSVIAYKLNASVAASLTVDSKLKISSVRYGETGNYVGFQIATNGTSKVSTIKIFGNDSTKTLTTSGAAKFQLWYVGSAGSPTPTATTTDSGSDGLLDTLTLAAGTGEGVSVDLTKFSNINALVNFINGQRDTGGIQRWFADASAAADRYSFSPRKLDSLASAVIGNASDKYPVRGLLQDIIDAINTYSTEVSAAVPSSITSRAAPADVTSTTNLSGGAVGSVGGTAFADALTALSKYDVPGIAYAGSESANVTLLREHCAAMSAPDGKMERTGYAGIKQDLSTLKTTLSALNSESLVFFGQGFVGTDRYGQPTTLPAWAWAVAACSARAGLQPGEPLTWKIIKATGTVEDASWTPAKDGASLILAGLCLIETDKRGVKFVKGITTYTQFDNDVYTEESIITNVKAMSKAWREKLEGLYTGRPVTVELVSAIKSASLEFWSNMRDTKRIVDTVVNGQITQLAYRGLLVKATKDSVFSDIEISPVSGLNFQLNTIRLVPGSISL